MSLRRLGIDVEAGEKRFWRSDAAVVAPMRSPSQLVEDGPAAIPVCGVWVCVPELLEQTRRRPGQERRGREPDQPARLDEVAQDAREAARRDLVPVLRCLRQDPR